MYIVADIKEDLYLFQIPFQFTEILILTFCLGKKKKKNQVCTKQDYLHSLLWHKMSVATALSMFFKRFFCHVSLQIPELCELAVYGYGSTVKAITLPWDQDRAKMKF